MKYQDESVDYNPKHVEWAKKHGVDLRDCTAGSLLERIKPFDSEEMHDFFEELRERIN